MKIDEQLALLLTKMDTEAAKSSECHTEVSGRIDNILTTVYELRTAKDDFENWRPEVDKEMESLRSSVADLRTKIEKSVTPSSNPFHIEHVHHTGDGSAKVLASAHLDASPSKAAPGPFGHHDVQGGSVHVYVQEPPILKGMKPDPGPHPSFEFAQTHTCCSHHHLGPAMPQIDFPKFSGTNPKLWIRQCETYFDLYHVPVQNWVKLATVNFTGPAEFWLQTIEINGRQCSWEELCHMVVDRFDRDHFNQFIRKFFHVQQTNTVLEYISSFDDLMHQMLAHDPHVNPATLTGKFIDGLKPEIHAAVILHGPKDLDTASSLDIIQEESMQGFIFKENKKQEFNYNTPKHYQKQY
jgi:hypothetical protein